MSVAAKMKKEHNERNEEARGHQQLLQVSKNFVETELLQSEKREQWIREVRRKTDYKGL